MLPTSAIHETETQAGPGRREHPRTLFSVPLKLQHLATGGLCTVRGISLDISEGGLGAMVQGASRVGEAVQIDFAMGERNVSAIGIVRHASNVRCGLEFLGLSQDERSQITSLVGSA